MDYPGQSTGSDIGNKSLSNIAFTDAIRLAGNLLHLPKKAIIRRASVIHCDKFLLPEEYG
jgi:hypothetical protein